MTAEPSLEKTATNGIRTALGVGGVLSLILGILILVWPGKTAMVGDTTHDLQMARNAACDGVGVTYGAHPASQLQELEPVALARSVPELRAFFAGEG